MLVSTLFSDIPGTRVYGEASIAGMTAHSQEVAPGFLFVALRGETFDGNLFVDEAILAGAAAIFSDMYNPFLPVVQVIHDDPRSVLPLVADRFYKSPSKELFTVGITGTNGKTTTAYMIAHLLDPCALLSTVEYRVGKYRVPARLTTPGLLMTQKLLADGVKEGCQAAVMEVSSHALTQGRTEGIQFALAVFTSFSQDHLDYHGTMEKYLEAKLSLFGTWPGIVNADMGIAVPGENLTYGIEAGERRATDIVLGPGRLSFCAPYPVELPMAGRHNVYNALAALLVAERFGLSEEVIQERLRTMPQVPGRLQRIENALGIDLYVDFAHTPDALQNVLETLRPLCRGALTVVFGCGGDRDKAKRPLMGEVAREYADRAIVTSDNPRREDPAAICAAIGGEVVLDRREAIARAISESSPGDTVVIAGRGHETEQVIGDTRVPFLDAAVAKEACENRIKLVN